MTQEPIDYCTSWWDGWPTWLGGTGHEWAPCCKAHDEFYGAYDGWWYIGAHWRLAECVAHAAGAGMAAIMFSGLVTFGSLVIVWRKNKLSQGTKGRPPGK